MALLKEADGRHDRADAGGEGRRPGDRALPEPLAGIEHDDRPTVLIAGPAAGAGMRADSITGWSGRAGLRCVGQVSLAEAASRLARMVRLDLLLVDLRGLDVAAELDRGRAQALTARYGLADTRLVVIADLDGLDCAMAMLDAPRAEFLCEPLDSDIVSLLVIAGLSRPAPGLPNFHDASRDTEASRLEQLSEEVRRLAATIERMALGNGAAPPDSRPAGAGSVGDRRDAYRADRAEAAADPARMFQPRERHRGAEAAGGEPTHAEVRAIIRARRMRDQYLPADLFADPAWDMILDLLAARLAGQRVSVSSLCIAASVPPTTALRWIRQLTDRAVFARIDDPADGRRVFIELTEAAAGAVLGWAQAVRRNGGILCAGGR